MNRWQGLKRVWVLALALVVLPLVGCGSAGGVTPSASRSSATVNAAGDSAALTPFYRRLAALESGQESGPLVVLQFGDSHTAGDKFSGRLRDLLQDRFGAAGRGSLPPGVPFDYYRPTLVSADQRGDWTVVNSFRSDASGLFGISGFRATSDDPDAEMTLASEEAAGFDLAEVVVVNQPGGGTLDVFVDGRPAHELSTDGPTVRAARLDLPVDSGSRSLSLRPRGDGPVSILGWTVERASRGVVLDSHGIVGSTVNVINRWEPSTVAWEIAHRNPALIILAYGTNEGFNDDLEAAEYARDFAARLADLRRAAPDAAIAVVGPPDANRLPRGCNGDGASCGVLSAAEAANYQELFRGDVSGAQCRWHPPPNLDVVRQVQREGAARHGAWFWDWSTVMNGACGIHQWATREPLMAYDDHVHLRTDGYRMSADALFAAMMRGYNGYRAAGGVAEHPF